jgi:hypothetical protein
MIAILAAAALQAAASSGPPPALVAAFRARDQALLDAIAPGDRALWDRTLAADALYVDEEGNILSRKAFLDQIKGLGPGATGHIAISDYRLQVRGDVATAIIKQDEQELWHGHQLTAQYLTTETWRREGKAWKLALAHVYVVAKDPPPVTLPAADLDPIVGRYRAAPDLVDVVARSGDHLTRGREGKPARPFLAETRDLFFTPGQPRWSYLIQRDAAGRVSGFIERREGQNILWTRTP